MPPSPPSHVAPTPPVMLQSLRPTERPSNSNREHSLAYFQSPFLSPIKEAISPVLSHSSSNTNLRRSTAIRRSSSTESVSRLNISQARSSNTGTPAPSQSRYFNLHRTASSSPDLSMDLGSEDDLHMRNATNEQYHESPAADSDSSIASFDYNSPVQRPVQKHPVKLISLHSTGPAAFYPEPVRRAGYSIRTDTR